MPRASGLGSTARSLGRLGSRSLNWPTAEFTRAFSGQILSLALTHALISEDQAQAASFEWPLRAEPALYAEGGRLTLKDPWS